jgi:hypothetical protein
MRAAGLYVKVWLQRPGGPPSLAPGDPAATGVALFLLAHVDFFGLTPVRRAANDADPLPAGRNALILRLRDTWYATVAAPPAPTPAPAPADAARARSSCTHAAIKRCAHPRPPVEGCGFDALTQTHTHTRASSGRQDRHAGGRRDAGARTDP